MRLSGRIWKDGKFWLAEVPMLDAMTQGRSEREALRMIADLVETMADKKGFQIDVFPGERGAFEIGAADAAALVAVTLRRQRENTASRSQRSRVVSEHARRRRTHATSKGEAYQPSKSSSSFSQPSLPAKTSCSGRARDRAPRKRDDQRAILPRTSRECSGERPSM